MGVVPNGERCEGCPVLSLTDTNVAARRRGPKSQWRLTLGDGIHWAFLGRTLVWASIEKAEQTAGANMLMTLETLNLRFFTMNRGTVERMMGRVRVVVETDSSKIPLHHHSGRYWYNSKKKPKRPLDSIILPAGIGEALVDDVETFLGSKAWCQARGVPYRRGYLFTGPPGTGKTSLIHALASHFNLGVAMLKLGSVGSDDSLTDAILEAPARSILVLEDVDVSGAPIDRKQEAGKDSKDLTMSAFLNAIDGLASSDDGRLLIMTTNHPERLDAALVRPGRVDYRVEFGECRPAELDRMFRRFFPDAGAGLVGAPHRTAAEAQEIMLRHRDDLEAARLALGAAREGARAA